MGKYSLFYNNDPSGPLVRLLHPLIVRGIGAHMGVCTVSKRESFRSLQKIQWCIYTPTFVLFVGRGRSA